MRTSTLHSSLALLATCATMALPMSTLAQESSSTLEEIQVTGSRIKRQDLEGVGPVTVFSAKDIEATGVTSTETLLQRFSASAGYAGNQTNAYWADNGYGTAQVNLRGLGVNRTLVLLNGRRVVNGGTGANSAVDLNMIPTSIIERIEVLKDGASALYGADAVAGVVNIITRKGFDGLKFGGKVGQTTEGDGEEVAADLTFGMTGDRGSLMGSISYTEGKAVNMADRAACALADAGDGTLECSGSSSTSGGRATLLSGPNIGQRINFNNDPNGSGDLFEPYSGGRHNEGYFQWLNAVNPIQKTTFSIFGNLNVTEGTRFFSEMIYSQRESDQIATPGTLLDYYQPGVGRTSFIIPASHPTNPTGQDIRLDRKRLVEAGVREFFQETDTWRVVLGFEGDLSPDWSWDVAYNKGRNTGIDGSTNVANLERVYQTMFACDNVTVPCADYLGNGDVSQQVLDYILYTQRDTGGNEQESITANITGKLFDLPAGALRFAAGAERREESGWRDPDPLVVANIANTNQQDPIMGKYQVDEVYAEIVAPLLHDLPAVQNLELSLAGRYSDYDLFGNDTNYKVGLLWQVVDGFKVRATRSTAFRIPNIPELYGGVAEGNLTTTDPCSGWSSLSPSDPIYQSCQLAGVPANYVQLGNTIRTTVGGNSELQPEDADTFTVGVVWEPGFVNELALTLDYWEIEIADSIQEIPGSEKLAICYEPGNLNHPFCGPEHHTRDSLTGEVNFLSAQPSNVGSETASGVDLGVVYATTLGGLSADLGWNISYLDEYNVTPFKGAAPIEYAGMITGGNGSYTHWRSDATMTVGSERWSGTWGVQYIGKADDINTDTGPGSKVDSLFYHNVQFSYRLTDAIDLAVGVDNLFDEDAPYVASWTDANTDTMTYDLLGQRWYLRASWNLQ
ncbi:TonB-dependent receptor [Steroidobacter sp.]|uniref:TonB-dependent receptor n=1 Tax=Steroidobacter sp. TaxID=1978227 RepID=UPI001A3BD812|nr:TonB-dependent receptor [Steroidobacter sp.]MBL8267211.1 TonB-dependent receptor [Steroidobacter sp.]